MIGKKVSHYQIIEKLGEGGMGIVYKARDLKLDRFVAIKFLPLSFNLDESFVSRFIQEAKTASSLDHQNICTIYEIGETDDKQLFIAMACYEGETLKTKLKNGPLDEEESLDIALELAEGLSEAHKNGIVHRDIKPANILITNKGNVKILDFGIAKYVSQHTKNSNLSSTSGTVTYMSPEQVHGDNIDYRSDIWSLGIVLYEMVSGHTPFAADYEQAVFYNIMHEKHEHIDCQNSENTKKLNNLISKCLEKNHEKRPASINEIIDLINDRESSNSPFFILNKFKYHLIILSLIIIISTIIFSLRPFDSSKKVIPQKQPWRVAVLPFIDNTNGGDTLDLSLMIQSLIVQELTGVAELAIIDHLSLNSYIDNSFLETDPRKFPKFYTALSDMPISYLIDGTITHSGKSYLIQCILIDPKKLTILFSKNTYFNNYKELPGSVDKLVTELLNYFQVKLLLTDKDLMPWIKPGTQNMGSIKAFLQASRYNFLGEKVISEKYFRRAIKLDSSFISPRILLVSSLVSQNKFDEVNQHLQKLEKFESWATPFEQAMIEWVRCYAINDVAGQIKHLKIALQYSPGNNMILFNLARVFYIKGEYEYCIETIKKSINLKWQYSPAYYLLGATYERIDDLDKAKNILKESLSIKPVFHEIYALLARMYLIENDTNTAEKYERMYIDRIKEMNLSLGNAYSYLGQQNYLSDNFNNAKNYFRKAVTHDSKNSEFHKQLAETCYKLLEIDSAIIECKYCLKLDSNKIELHYFLGKIYEELNDIDNARLYYSNFLIKDSTSQLAKEIIKSKAFIVN